MHLLRHITRFPRLIMIWQWLLLFTGLVVVLYAASQSQAAPLVIIFIALYIITWNFSIPVPYGAVGLFPLISVSSLLVLGLDGAFLAFALGLTLGELSRPLWEPLWQRIARPRLAERAILALIYGAALGVAYAVYSAVGGQVPLAANSIGPLSWLAASYVITYFSLTLLAARALGQPLASFFHTNALKILGAGIFAQPFAFFAALAYRAAGLPAFAIFCFGILAFTFTIWLSWLNGYVLRQQLAQLSELNRASSDLRGTLDLPVVLEQTYAQVSTLVPVDIFSIFLRNEDEEWERPLHITMGERDRHSYVQPDDLTKWVAATGRVLELDSANMHFAARHHLSLPEPKPSIWLGIPLTTSRAETADHVIGVLVMQRLSPLVPFSRWNREVLLTIARQASSAIQNAQLHSETVRLYTLADQALARRVEQLQALLNSTNDGVLMLDSSGHVVLANPLADQYLRPSAQTESGNSALTTLNMKRLGYAPAELMNLLVQLKEGEIPPKRSLIYQTTFGGEAATVRYMQRAEAPVLADDGRLMGWLIVLRDVTEAEERVQWRTQFTHMVVHDLRNPVTTLINTLNTLDQALPRPVKGEERRDNAINELVRNGRRGCLHMLDMIDSLMDINRMEAGQLNVEAEAMRLPPLIGRIIDAALPVAFEKGVELYFQFPDDLPAVWGDGELLRRVVVNLLDNALKFTPAGGSIVGCLEAEPTAAPYTGEAGVRCTIQDTGPGIPPNLREHIFERFVRISQGGAQVRGTGIGLTFCKMAIEAQGGRIWVEENAAGGSKFVFTVPGIPNFD